MTDLTLVTEAPDEEGNNYAPPQDLAAEMSVLGSMMLTPRVIDEVLEVAIGPDFYRPAHQLIFDAVAHLHFDGQPVDAVTVADELKRRGQLKRAGGHAYLHQCVGSVAVAASADYYARIVADKALRRRLLDAGTRITSLAHADTGDLEAVISQAQSEVDDVASRRVTEMRSAAETVDDVVHEMENPTRLLSVPWPSMQHVINGLAPGRVTVIGARPGAGKTAMAIGFTLWWLQHHGLSVAFSSLEMSRQEITQRVLSSMSGVPFSAIETGDLTERMRSRFDEAAGTLRRLPPLWIDDRESVDVAQVRAFARRAKQNSRLGLVVIDYLQLMESGKPGENRNQEVARFSRNVKKLARSLDVPVLLLSQLNRGSENRGQESAPRLSDLRDSGAVEQDADVVMLLHKQRDEDDRVLVGVGKNRQGPKSGLSLTFDGPRMTFLEPAHH